MRASQQAGGEGINLQQKAIKRMLCLFVSVVYHAPAFEHARSTLPELTS